MPVTIAEGLYLPAPLVEGARALLAAHLPDDIVPSVNSDEVPERGVLLWDTTPSQTHLTLAGPTHATLRLTARSVDTSRAAARAIGDRVRLVLAGRDSRGRLAYPIEVEGFTVDDVVASEGHGALEAGVGQWTEVFTVRYQAVAVAPTVA